MKSIVAVYGIFDNNYRFHVMEVLSIMQTLRCMKKGERLRIVAVKAQGELGRRIRDMGLLPGTEIVVLGHAPLKDPVALRLAGFTLALRNKEADRIMVETVGGVQ